MERLSHSRPTMPLTLRAVSLNDQPITQPITASFGPKGGSIGRADTNTLPLPDPERRISRRQAEIVATGDGFAIKNVGSANPIIVREQSLALGESAPLRHDDQVRIGGYLLEVIQPSDDGDDRTSLDAPRSPADPFAPIASCAVAWRSAGGSVAQRARVPAFLSVCRPRRPALDRQSVRRVARRSTAGAATNTAPAPSSASPAPARLPDDFDPFAPAPAPAAPPARPADLG